MPFNPNWRNTPAAIRMGYGPEPTPTPQPVASSAPSFFSRAAAAPASIARPQVVQTAQVPRYVPSTGSTLNQRSTSTRSHPQSQDWYRGDPDGKYSWGDLGRDISGVFSPNGTPLTPVERQNLTEAEVQQGSIKRAEDMTTAEKTALGWQGNTSDKVLEALGGDVAAIRANDDAIMQNEKEWRDAAITDEAQRRQGRGVTVRDESDPDRPSWGTGYQAISKEDVLKNVAEPVEIKQELYDSMDARQRAAIDFNTLLNEGDKGGNRDALAEALQLDLEKDELLTNALVRQMGSDAVAHNPLQARAGAVSQATKQLGRAASATTSAWEADTSTGQINDFLNDKLSQNQLAMQEAMQGGYNLQTLPQNQAFEVMFNDLADEDQGEWTADDLVGLLEQGGYDPNEFWNWAGQRLNRFRASSGEGTLSPVENPRSVEDMAGRLQINLGG